MNITLGKHLKYWWSEFFSGQDFEWFVTLTFQRPVSAEVARRHFIEWVRSLCVDEHIQVAAKCVYNRKAGGHLHLLMLGHNKEGKKLCNVSKEKWSKEWSTYKCGCLIKNVRDLKGAARYLSCNLDLNDDDPYSVFEYNTRLLRKAGFDLAPEPDFEDIEAVYRMLVDMEPCNESQIFELVKAELDISGKEKLAKLLEKGEGEYWDSRKDESRGNGIFYFIKPRDSTVSPYMPEDGNTDGDIKHGLLSGYSPVFKDGRWV